MDTLGSLVAPVLRAVEGSWMRIKRPDLTMWVGGGITGRSGTSGAPSYGYDEFHLVATNASQKSILINRHELWAWKKKRDRWIGHKPRVIQLSHREGSHLLKPFSDSWNVTYRCENLADVSITHPFLELVLWDTMSQRVFRKPLRLVLDNRRFNAKLLKYSERR